MGLARAVLAPLIVALEADGYGALIDDSDPDDVRFTIVAGPSACADCLSPRTILEPMILDALRRGGIEARLELVYPPEH